MKTRREFFGYAAAPVVALAAHSPVVKHRVADDIQWPDEISEVVRQDQEHDMAELLRREPPGQSYLATHWSYGKGYCFLVTWMQGSHEPGVWRPYTYQTGPYEALRRRGC